MDDSTGQGGQSSSNIEIVPPQALEGIPKEHQPFVEQGVRQYIEYEQQIFTGPIPPPILFGEYEQILPGSANRILALAENQQAHRIKMEALVLGRSTVNERLGLILGFIIAFSAVLGGIGLVTIGRDVAGFVLLLGTVSTLAGTFIYSSKLRKEERQERLKEFTQQQERSQNSPPQQSKKPSTRKKRRR